MVRSKPNRTSPRKPSVTAPELRASSGSVCPVAADKSQRKSHSGADACQVAFCF